MIRVKITNNLTNDCEYLEYLKEDVTTYNDLLQDIEIDSENTMIQKISYFLVQDNSYCNLINCKKNIITDSSVNIFIHIELSNFEMNIDIDDNEDVDISSINESFDISKANENSESIGVFVKTFTGKTIVIVLNKEDTIRNLKKNIVEKEKILSKPEDLRLIFKGRQLQNYHTLSFYDIENESTVHLVMKLRGGGPQRIYSVNTNNQNSEKTTITIYGMKIRPKKGKKIYS